jgi:hypothetical protein
MGDGFRCHPDDDGRRDYSGDVVLLSSCVRDDWHASHDTGGRERRHKRGQSDSVDHVRPYGSQLRAVDSMDD